MIESHYLFDENSFIDEEDKQIFEDYMNDPSAVLIEMANMVGNDVAVEKRLPFSFHFCDKDAVHGRHGIRAKIIWNPSKAPASADGYMELHGDYKYMESQKKYKPDEKEIRVARDFFKKYKVLFAAVWEKKLDPSYVQKYLSGTIQLNQVLMNLQDVTEKQFYWANHAKTVEELESIVRDKKIFNMND